MAVKDVVKVSRKTFFNPSGWLGYTALKTNSQFVWQTLRQLMTAPESTLPAETTETFEEALQRYNLTPEAVKEIEKDYLFYAGLFLFLGIFSILVGLYFLFFERTIVGFLLSLAVTMLFGSQAFRYHFWYFQIKQRKLGCTLNEWLETYFPQVKRPGP